MKQIKFLLILAAVFAATNAFAFTYITGSGTSGDPYLIGSADAWNELCTAVHNNGNTFSGKFLKQTADITVSNQTGLKHNNYPFSGEYDGDGHTMNLAITVTDGAADYIECAAPFGVVSGATIKNLHITGSVSTNFMRPASLVGFVASGTCTILNCWSEVDIRSTHNKDVDAGGFVARVDASHAVEITGCLFTGKIRYTNSGYEGGGFVGYTQDNANTMATITDCVFAPEVLTLSESKDKFYSFVGHEHSTITNCYYNSLANAASIHNEGTRAHWVKGGDGIYVYYSSVSASEFKNEYDVSRIRTYTNGMQVGEAVYGPRDGSVLVSYFGSESGVYMAEGDVLDPSPQSFNMTTDYTINQPVADVYYSSEHHYYMVFSTAVTDWTDGRKLILLRKNIEYGSTITLTGSSSRELDLNGCCLKFTGATGEVLQVTDNAALTIVDGNTSKTHKFSVDANNFATLEEESGTVTINGGCITGGKGGQTRTSTTNENGGAIFIKGGNVTMSGGTIIGNQANRHAGGVFVTGGGQFTLNSGAAIKHNKAGMFGGGISAYGSTEDVDITAGGEVVINGGVVANNYAPNEAGGIHTNTANYSVSVTIKGASQITGNKSNGNGGGILVASNATLAIQDNPVISGNYKGAAEQNVYLPDGKKITISEDLGSSANVGVTMKTPGTFTSGLPTHGDETKFFSDDNTKVVTLDENAEAMLVAPLEVTVKEDPQHAGVYYSTLYYSSQRFQMTNDGTKAYTAEIQGSNMYMHEIASGTAILAEDVAVILKSSSSPITLIPTGKAATAATEANDLMGVDVDTEIADKVSAGSICYVFSGKGSKGVGFYRYESTLHAHKAYAVVTPNSGAGAPPSLHFVYDSPTGIEEMNQEPATNVQKMIVNGQFVIVKDGVWYNAQGQVVK